REQPDVIFSSALPPTSHLVARRLSRKARLPWVAEFRDLWTDNHAFQRIQPLLTVERILERWAMREADALVTVSEPLADTLRKRLNKPVFVVPNGYDPDDFPTGV